MEPVVAVTRIMIGGMTEDMTDMRNMTTDTGTQPLFDFCTNSGFVGKPEKLGDKTVTPFIAGFCMCACCVFEPHCIKFCGI